MPWKENPIMEQKKKFVVKSLEKGMNFTELCREFGIRTKTGYKWKQRFLEGGFPALEDHRRTPKHSSKATSAEVVLLLVNYKTRKKNWGAKKILINLKKAYPDTKFPCARTVERIFFKAGLMEKKKRIKSHHLGERLVTREKAVRPNHVWTVDFKGWWYTQSKEKCNPLTIRDEYSKYIFSIKALEKGDIISVKREFERVFKGYGLPEVIRSDNGPPFAAMNSIMGLTKLSVWWLSLGIKLDRIEPGKPYQNGGHERMHLDMKRELEAEIVGDLVHHQKIFEVWKKEYNRERPHEALKDKTPSEVYERSKINYDETYSKIEYPITYRSRQVDNKGYMTWNNQKILIGNPFSGWNVGIKLNKNGVIDVYFGTMYLGELDTKNRLLNTDENSIKRKKKR